MISKKPENFVRLKFYGVRQLNFSKSGKLTSADTHVDDTELESSWRKFAVEKLAP